MAAPAASGTSRDGGVAAMYIMLYNIVQFLGWSWILYVTVNVTLLGGGSPAVWQATRLPLMIFQTAAILEVLHCMFGLVRGSVMTTAIQVGSRLWVLWGIVYLVPSDTTRGWVPYLRFYGPSFATLVVAWALSEIVRYGFFAAKAMGINSRVLLWLRYSGFLVLYPVGVASELTMAGLALETIKRNRPLTLTLPNPYNFAFDYYIACIIIMVVYAPGLPHMYTHMVRQRAKYLGGSIAARRKTA